MMNHLFIKRDLISYQDQTPVMPTIERGIPRTLSLAIGCRDHLAGVRHHHRGAVGPAPGAGGSTASLTVVALGGVSIPIFWLGAVLLYLLTFRWHASPAVHLDPAGRVRAVRARTRPEWATHLFLPWIVLAVVSIGFYARVVRDSLLETRQPGLRAHRPREGALANGAC